ncbi:unnamed protein product [Pleuronectes platessa]|uniref:Uncharacterized protein n=1 Tax=Pleuronectes platessa TaxID=8262 RepID=A0A9N7VMS3_PLEPL|nr:unnamed protein product [Pleuronectes platessa]
MDARGSVPEHKVSLSGGSESDEYIHLYSAALCSVWSVNTPRTEGTPSPDEQRGDSLTPTLSPLRMWGDVVNRQRDPKCKQTLYPCLRSGAPLALSALVAPVAVVQSPPFYHHPQPTKHHQPQSARLLPQTMMEESPFILGWETGAKVPL